MLSHSRCVSVDHVSRVGRISNRFGEVTIIEDWVTLVHVGDLVVGEPPVSIPFAFSDMEGSGIVQAGIRRNLPTDILSELRDGVGERIGIRQ